MRPMRKDHADRMTDQLIVDETEAIPALAAGRLVYALETPDGDWGEVESIEEFRAKARRAPSFTVTFVSGKVRIFRRGGTFHVERERKAWEA